MSLAVLASSAALIVWTYVGFPAVTLVRAAVRPRPHRSGNFEEPVSVVIAAHNEEQHIGRKLESVLAQDYPADRLSIVVAADGCSDATEEVVSGYADRGVRLLALPRVGKAAALNAAVAASEGSVVVFSDANSILAPDSIRHLVRPFADPQVGGVAGDQRYLPDNDPAKATGGERSYWSLDRMMKRAQSRAGNVISATGALYAIRRDLFTPVAEGVTDDFFTSTGVITAGRRLVFADDAAVYEEVASSGSAEYARKVRVMTRGLRGVWLRRELLDPRRQGFFAVQLFSHKVLRRAMVLPLAGLLLGSALRREPVFRLAAAGQVLLYLAGAAGLLLKPGKGKRLLSLPAYFVMVNIASAHAGLNLIRGRRIDLWAPKRVPGSPESPESPDMVGSRSVA